MPVSFAIANPAAPQVAEGSLDFEGVYRRHFASVWRVLRRLGVAHAQLDDACQDVFVVVHRRLGEYEARGTPSSWLYAIALRVASEYRRGTARRRTEPLPEVIDPAPGPARQTEQQKSIELLHRLLGALDDDKRTVFVLAELEQLSSVEIAAVLGVNLNTVYSRLRAARQHFEAALDRHRARMGKRGQV